MNTVRIAEEAPSEPYYRAPAPDEISLALEEAKNLLGDAVDELNNTDDGAVNRTHLILVTNIKNLVDLLSDDDDLGYRALKALSFVELARMALAKPEGFIGGVRISVGFAVSYALQAALMQLSDPATQESAQGE